MMLARHMASFALVGFFVAGSLAAATATTACKGTCSDSESQACTETYTSCINEAASSADKSKCQACVDNYCACYDKCGSTGDRSKVNGTCGQ